ncbi:hypothetical protein Dvina_53555 [Dactylosporangium vinaceum]|uniref:Integral membrane protein n=1 Tax=Dactylosporangium vinaceum TaxID=53362 RepID=A0ABV5MPX2_9ACTN|nr:hypothetical protein [Dactylosporangium vinaceum]UAB96627.1 hypothetical protein Dvina_53555 [Dactylosporangium vinaceum]
MTPSPPPLPEMDGRVDAGPWPNRRREAFPIRLGYIRRLGFTVLGLLNLVWGAWGVAAPRHFFSTFPGFGLHWTSSYPPFNQHLTVDLGATMLTLATLFIGAAIVDKPAVSGLVGAATAVFGTLHFGYHALHAGQMGTADRVMSLVTLIGGALLPPALAATHRLEESR